MAPTLQGEGLCLGCSIYEDKTDNILEERTQNKVLSKPCVRVMHLIVVKGRDTLSHCIYLHEFVE